MKIWLLFFATAFVLMSEVSPAAVIFGDDVTISGKSEFTGIVDVSLMVESGDTICSRIAEVDSAFICIPEGTAQMNDMFTRMGFYWGSVKGLTAGTLIPHSNSTLKQYNQVISGHNLPGNIIYNFLQAAEASTDADIKLNSLEREFAQVFAFNPKIKSLNQQFYLIAVAADNPYSFRSTISHEIHHARYYLQAPVRSVINEFWQNVVTTEDKAGIRAILGQAYNSDNESLIIDEFQAYLLEPAAKEKPLAKYVDKYQALLLKALKEKAGYQLIEVK